MAIFNNNQRGVAKPQTHTQGGSQGTIFGGTVQKGVAETDNEVPTSIAVAKDGTVINSSTHTIDLIGDGFTATNDNGTVDITVDETYIATRDYVDEHSLGNLTAGTGIDITDDVISVDTDTIATQAYVDDEIAAVDLEDLNDVTITNVQNGQSVVWDANQSMWINSHDAGPVNPVDPNDSKITLTATPNEIELAASGTSNITVNSTLTSGYTRVTTSIRVTDQERNPVTVVTATPTSITFVADHTLKGHFTVTATVVVTKTGETEQFTDTATLIIPVNEPFYTATTTTEPTAITSMTDAGVFDHNTSERVTYTGNGGTRKAYVAVPTGNYEFHNGFAFAGITEIGVISTNWTLYEFTDFDDSQNNATFVLTITEE